MEVIESAELRQVFSMEHASSRVVHGRAAQGSGMTDLLARGRRGAGGKSVRGYDILAKSVRRKAFAWTFLSTAGEGSAGCLGCQWKYQAARAGMPAGCTASMGSDRASLTHRGGEMPGRLFRWSVGMGGAGRLGRLSGQVGSHKRKRGRAALCAWSGRSRKALTRYRRCA